MNFSPEILWTVLTLSIIGICIVCFLITSLYLNNKMIKYFNEGKTLLFRKGKESKKEEDFHVISKKNNWILKGNNLIKDNITLNIKKFPTKWYFVQ